MKNGHKENAGFTDPLRDTCWNFVTIYLPQVGDSLFNTVLRQVMPLEKTADQAKTQSAVLSIWSGCLRTSLARCSALLQVRQLGAHDVDP